MSPQLQWLGQMPEKTSALADVLKAGVKPGIEAYEKAQERGVELKKISYEKKKDAADTIVKMFQDATPQQKEQAFGDNAPDTKVRDLILETHGQETIDTLLGTTGKGVADKLRKVEAWITTGRVKDAVMGGTMPQDKEQMNWNVMMELGAKWEEEYPHLSDMFNTFYQTPTTSKSKEKEKGFFGKYPSPAEYIRKKGWRGTEAQEEKVVVISPEGVKGRIPKSQLSEALAKGYKRAR